MAEPAVDVQDFSGDRGGQVREQERSRVTDVLGTKSQR